MKTNLLIIACLDLLLLNSCCWLFPSKCKKDKIGAYEQISNNITTPQYLPLNIPMSDMPLPAFLIDDVPQGGCFKKGVARSTALAIDSLRQVADKDKKFEAALKSEFENAAVKANLTASLSKALTEHFETQIYGMRVVSIDPADAFPNFTNANCNTPELDYFVNNRTVLIAGLKADSITVKMHSGLTSEQKAKVDAAIDTLNLKLGLSFSKAVNSNAEFSFSGRDLFFGSKISPLKAIRSKQSFTINLSIGETKQLKYNGDKYTLKVTRSAIESSDRLTINFIDESNHEAQTGPQDIDIKNALSFTITDNRRMNLSIEKKGKNRYVFDVSMLVVGISGGE